MEDTPKMTTVVLSDDDIMTMNSIIELALKNFGNAFCKDDQGNRTYRLAEKIINLENSLKNQIK